MRKSLLFLMGLLAAMSAWAQGALGPIPEKVDYRDAKILDVGVKWLERVTE